MEKKRLMDFELGASYARIISASEWAETDQPVVIDPILNRFNTTDINYIVGVCNYTKTCMVISVTNIQQFR